MASVLPCSSPPHVVPANDQPPPNLRHQGDRAPGLGASGIPPKALGSAFDRFPPWFLRPQPAQSTRPPLPLVSCSSPMISGAPSFPPKSSAQCVVATNPPLMRGALLFSLAPSLGRVLQRSSSSSFLGRSARYPPIISSLLPPPFHREREKERRAWASPSPSSSPSRAHRRIIPTALQMCEWGRPNIARPGRR